jgi:Na+-transporting NADH:ubiquinone oxidoreductase subunit NqrF
MHIYTLKVVGEASKKLVQEFRLDTLDMSEAQGMMGWLRGHKIPIASSCYGDGVCRRCKITKDDQSEILSCMTTLYELFGDSKEVTIYISYL